MHMPMWFLHKQRHDLTQLSNDELSIGAAWKQNKIFLVRLIYVSLCVDPKYFCDFLAAIELSGWNPRWTICCPSRSSRWYRRATRTAPSWTLIHRGRFPRCGRLRLLRKVWNFVNICRIADFKLLYSLLEGAATKSSTFFSFEYYQTFFDVDTMTVVERVVNSIIPKRAPTDYLQLNIGTSPDLYGPIWIVITLVKI